MPASARAVENTPPSRARLTIPENGSSPAPADELSPQDQALLRLGAELLQQDYRFTTVTPATHQIVQARSPQGRPTLRDIFGWSLPFGRDDLPNGLIALLDDANMLTRSVVGFRSAVRFSTLGGQIFVHSAFPTAQAD